MLSVEEVIALLDQARRGDAAAYDRLYEGCREALCGSILRFWPYEARPSREAAEALALQTWEKNRGSILRAPSEGGYTADSGGFHRWVLKKCTEWRNVRPEDDLGSGNERPWPTDEQGRLIELPDWNQRTPDELVASHQAFALLLEIRFLPEVGYPHQQLSFVLSKYVYGVKTPRGIDGKPEVVVERHRQMQLHALGGVVGDAYLSLDFPGAPPTAGQIPCLAGLYQRLGLTLSELMAGDGESLEQFRTLRALLAGETRLENYFAGGDSDPKDAISLWSHRVSRAVRRLLGPVPCSDKSRFWAAAEHVPRSLDK